MLSFFVRRLLAAVPTVLAAVTITWGLVRLAPGSFYSAEKSVSPAIERNLRLKYGLDRPVYEQYGLVLWHTARLDFGNSLVYEGQSVRGIIGRALPVSAAMGGLAYLLALVVGLSAGALSAARRDSRVDYVFTTLTLIGVSVPSFVLGPLLVLCFSLRLYWLPPARWAGFPSQNLVLPVLTLSAAYAAYVARLTRAGLLEVLRTDYVRTARAKGLREHTVVLKHALRVAVVPVVSFSGPALAFLLSGTVVVERIFALPGLGSYFINASLNRDEPLLLGIVACTSIIVTGLNLVADVMHALLDPRIRH